MGFEADIKAMPEAYEYSRAFFRRFYRPENVVLLVAGDVDPAATLALVEKYYGPWQPGYEPPKIAARAAAESAKRTAEVAYPGRTLPILSIAYKGDAFDPANRDYVAAACWASWPSAQQRAVQASWCCDEQKVEMLGAERSHEPRPLAVRDRGDGQEESDDSDAVRRRNRPDAGASSRSQPVATQKLDELKRRNKYAFLMELDTPENVAGDLARSSPLSGGIEAVDQLYAAFGAGHAAKTFMDAARKYFVPERRTVVVLKGARRECAVDVIDCTAGGISVVGACRDCPLCRACRDRPCRACRERPPCVPEPGAGDLQASERQSAAYRARPTRSPSRPWSCCRWPATRPSRFRIWFQVGSQDDPPGKEGLAALTAAMLAEGSTRRTATSRSSTSSFRWPAGYSASTSVEMTVISGRVHKDNLAGFYPLLIEAILSPGLQAGRPRPHEEPHAELPGKHAPLCQRRGVGKAVLYNTIFAGTPYGHLPPGRSKACSASPWTTCGRSTASTTRGENVVIGLGGGYDPATAATGCGSDLADLPAGQARRRCRRRSRSRSAACR